MTVAAYFPLFFVALISVATNGFSIPSSKVKTFYIGCGCFWAPADNLRDVPDIVSTTVGYCGDDSYDETFKSPPSYETVCAGRTRLVEAIRVEYNSDELSYSDMLSLFAKVNTAEYRNKRQYQGIIFTSSDEEAAEAEKFLEDDKSIIGTVEPMSNVFFTAEDYHQDYWQKWRTRLASFTILVAVLVLNEDAIGRELSQKIWNILCYGGIAFTILERRFDSGRKKNVVGQLSKENE